MPLFVIETPYWAELRRYRDVTVAEDERRRVARQEQCCTRCRAPDQAELYIGEAFPPKGPRMHDCEIAHMGKA